MTNEKKNSGGVFGGEGGFGGFGGEGWCD